MPSKRKTNNKGKGLAISARNVPLVPFLMLSLVFWFMYRSLFDFSVWFDESIGKAIFLGAPVWLFVVVTNFKDVAETFSFRKMRRGLSLGVAVGGLFGFATVILKLITQGGEVQPAALFMADGFWWEFFLAILTAFWETLFFYSFVQLMVMKKYHHWSLLKQIIFTAAVFTVFHLPNSILRFSGVEILYQAMLLMLFAVGQGYLFAAEKNAYALVLSHTFWGMVLLFHF